MPDSNNQEALQQFLRLVKKYGLEASPINFQTEASRSICERPYEIRNPDDPSQVIADGSLDELYMNVGPCGNYRRVPTPQEIRKLRRISEEAGIRVIQSQTSTKTS